MNMYYIAIIMIVFLPGLFSKATTDKQKAKMHYVIFISIMFILMTGLRHESVGADTLNYKLSYYNVAKTSWSELFNNLSMYFSYGNDMLNHSELRDPGYNIFVKFTQIFCTNYRFYMFLIGIIVHVPLGILIYQNSKNPPISFLTYLLINYSMYGTTGYRQAICYAMVTILGFKFIKERRLKPYLLLILSCFLIHKSVLITIPFYFLANKKVDIKYLLFCLGIVVIAFIFKTPLSDYFKSISGYEQSYSGQYEGAGTWVFTSMLGAVYIYTCIFLDNILEYDNNAKYYINGLVMSAFFVPLTFVNPSAMRVVEYFSFYIALLLPCFVSADNKNSNGFVIYMIVYIFIILCIKTNPYYKFMWQ